MEQIQTQNQNEGEEIQLTEQMVAVREKLASHVKGLQEEYLNIGKEYPIKEILKIRTHFGYEIDLTIKGFLGSVFFLEMKSRGLEVQTVNADKKDIVRVALRIAGLSRELAQKMISEVGY
jgi:hypothetical protein